MAVDSAIESPQKSAGQFQKITRENPKEYLPIFSQVSNKVIAVNPDLNIPINLKEGEASPLGVFLRASSLPFEDLSPNDKHLEVWAEHTRTALLGRVVFSDRESNLYRDIDLKGVGVFRTIVSESGVWVSPDTPGWPRAQGGRQGLLDRDEAYFDYQMSEKFHNAGIRTNRAVAIIELNELIADGRKISLEDAIQKEIMDSNFHPVVEVRAFGTKARIQDYLRLVSFGMNKENEGSLLIKDAQNLVGRELGKTDLTDEEYMDWFTEELGRSVGIMHKNGWVHGFLTQHNITLDCRIVDLDSVGELTDEEKRLKDLKNTEETLSNFSRAILGDSSKIESKYAKKFRQNYTSAYSI